MTEKDEGWDSPCIEHTFFLCGRQHYIPVNPTGIHATAHEPHAAITTGSIVTIPGSHSCHLIHPPSPFYLKTRKGSTFFNQILKILHLLSLSFLTNQNRQFAALQIRDRIAAPPVITI